MLPTPPTAQEPDSAFNTRCIEVLDLWEAGTLPFKQAQDQMEALAVEARADGHHANMGRVQQLMGVIQGYRANYDASIRHFEAARDHFERANNRKRAIGSLLNQGESYRLKGDFTRARQLFRTAYEGACELGDLRTQAIASCNEGLMLLSMERWAGAHALFDRAARLASQLPKENHLSLMSEIQHGLAITSLRTDALDEAWRYAREGFRLAMETSQPLDLGLANRTMGEVVTAMLAAGKLNALTDPTDNAAPDTTQEMMAAIFTDPDDYFRAAADAFGEIKADGEVARTMYAHALSLSARGRGMTAARKLQQAVLIFTRLGMADDAAKAAHAQQSVLSNTG